MNEWDFQISESWTEGWDSLREFVPQQCPPRPADSLHVERTAGGEAPACISNKKYVIFLVFTFVTKGSPFC